MKIIFNEIKEKRSAITCGFIAKNLQRDICLPIKDCNFLFCKKTGELKFHSKHL